MGFDVFVESEGDHACWVQPDQWLPVDFDGFGDAADFEASDTPRFDRCDVVDYDHAEAHFGAAEEQNTALGSQFFAAYDALDRATMYLSRNGDGDRERAEQYATRAIESAREHGYAHIEQRAAALLQGLPAV